MALLDATLLYIILPWLYFTIFQSTLPYHGANSLYFLLFNSNMAVLHPTLLYITSP